MTLKTLYSKEYYEAVARKWEFLEKHPHLVQLQDKIDEALAKASDKNRLAVIHNMMIDSALELQNSIQNLLVTLNK